MRKVECPRCQGHGWIEPKGSQSDEQRGVYWAQLHSYGDKQGYNRKETDLMLHNAVLCEAYGVKRYINYRGVMWPVPRERSSEQNTENYSKLIDALLRLIAEDAILEEA